MNVVFKCKKCRLTLLQYPDSSLLSAHGQQMSLKNHPNSAKVEFVDKLLMEDTRRSKTTQQCSSLSQDVFYIDDINIPQWISDCIAKGDWTRGKLMCPGCAARLGSFDFVSGLHCACQSSVVPSVHLVKSKVDYSSSINPLGVNEECI